MGLGKTVQSVSFLHYLHSTQGLWGPFLVVAPLSTLSHWQRELEAWTDFNVIVYHGPKEARQKVLEHEWWFEDGGDSRVHKFNVLVTTYEMINLPAAPDEPDLARTHWRCLVVDEAHRLKNPESKLMGALLTFSYDHMVLLTGTPLQNNLSELYALLHFLDHTSFPSLDDWERRFGGCATRKDAEKLNEAMRPFVLRRMKADVEKSVPPKEETVVHVELTAVQKQWCDGTLLGHGAHSHTATQLSHPAPRSTTGTALSTSVTSPSSQWRGGRRRRP